MRQNTVQATLVELRGSQLMGTRPIPMIGVVNVRFTGLTLPSEDLNRSHHLAPDGAFCQERFSFFLSSISERRRENGDGGARLWSGCLQAVHHPRWGEEERRGRLVLVPLPPTSVSWFLIYIFL